MTVFLRWLLLGFLCAALVGCAGVHVYKNGKRIPNAGIQVKEVEPWLAVYPSGEIKVVEIPTGEEREYVPHNFLSRSNISIDVRESGSLSRFGIENDSAGITDAIKTAAASQVRSFASDSSLAVVLIKARTIAQGPVEKIFIYSDGRIVKKK